MPRPKIVRYPHLAKFAPDVPVVLTTDGVVPIDEDATFSMEKGSAGAYSVAAPGQKNVGRRLQFNNGSDFAHIVTFTGTTLEDGTIGLNTTWTAAAFAGSALSVYARSATRWCVEAFNLGTIAP